MTNPNPTAATVSLALDVADATIAALTAKLAAMEAVAGAAAVETVAGETVMVFSEAAPAPNASAPMIRATVYEAATRAAAGEITANLTTGARGIGQTVEASKVGGSLHIMALAAAFSAGMVPGDAITGEAMYQHGVKPSGFRNWSKPETAKVAVSRLALAGLVARIGAGVGTKGLGYVAGEEFFAGACHVLTWEDGAITDRRLAVVR